MREDALANSAHRLASDRGHEVKTDTVRNRIIQELTTDGSATIGYLAVVLETPVETINWAMAELAEEGVVRVARQQRDDRKYPQPQLKYEVA